MASSTVTQVNDMHHDTPEEADLRHDLGFKAAFEIQNICEMGKNICQSDDWPKYNALFSRINQLAGIIYYTQRLYDGTDEDVGGPDLKTLEQLYKGNC